MTESAASKLPPHRKVHVELGARAYDVVIGREILNQVGALMTERQLREPLVIITDSRVKRLMSLESLSDGLGPFKVFAPKKAVRFGEQSKSMKNVANILSALAKLKIPRTGTIVAVGGGVIGDLAGFVAACYLRGINFVQVPTTLLAMVDSSVGGKTGVNLPEGKNLVGAFHQPKLVVADLNTLKTLRPPEFAAGMAEVIKYGAIRDKALFDRVVKGVKPDDSDLDEIVEKCVSIKARIVENDEFETKGERALLNFGHTIGHAIEKATEYKAYLHGEAISLGMRAAAWLSVWQAGLPEADALRIESALAANALPITLKPEVDRAAILAALGNDKKVAADGRNRWVLLKSLGEATSGHELPAAVVEKAVSFLSSP
jgi:3-dehydroquinate synthase